MKYFNICSGATLEMKFTALQSEVVFVLWILVNWQTLSSSSKLIAMFVAACDEKSEFYKCIVIILYIVERRDVICGLFCYFSCDFWYSVEYSFSAPKVTWALLMKWHFTWQWGVFSNRNYVSKYCLKYWACFSFYSISI